MSQMVAWAETQSPPRNGPLDGSNRLVAICYNDATCTYMISVNRPADFTPSDGVGQDVGLEAHGMRQPARGVDAGQLIDAPQQVDRIDRPVLDLFGLGIGGPDDVAALESAARHQHAEDVAVVVAAAVPGRLPIDLGTAAEFAAAPDQRAFQQPAVLQVGQQRRPGPGRAAGIAAAWC